MRNSVAHQQHMQLHLECYFLVLTTNFMSVGDAVALWSLYWDSRLRSAGLSAGQVNVLCSWVKHFTLTVPLSIQDHKWVVANFWGSLKKCWGETLSWTSNRSQMMSNVVRTSVTHSAAPHVPLLFSYHILTSSMIYYWTDARQLGIYLLNRPMSTRDPFVKYLNW